MLARVQLDIVWYGDTATKLIDVFKEHHNVDTWKTLIGDFNFALMGIPGTPACRQQPVAPF